MTTSAALARLILAALAFCLAYPSAFAQAGPRPRPQYLMTMTPDHVMTNVVPFAYPRPASAWQSGEKAFYARLLAQGKFDVMVLPFQSGDRAFDRSTRALMTAELAKGIARTMKVKVPDPYLVAAALGDGQRQLQDGDVAALAIALGIKRLVYTGAGHDGAGKMSIWMTSMSIQDETTWRDHPAAGPGKPAPVGLFNNAKTIRDVPFGEDNPAIEAFEALLPELIKIASGMEVLSTPPRTQGKLDLAALPPSPISLAGSSTNPARDAYVFLLFSQLTPALMGRERERFAEKAYLALQRLNPGSPEYRALRARTYMALGHRLAALKAIGTPRTDEERELVAALNGNLPQMAPLAAREANPLKRILAKLDENLAATRYGVRSQKESLAQAQDLKLPGKVWPFIVARAFTSPDDWAQYDNAYVKQILDLEFPIQGYSLEDLARGAASLGSPEKIRATVNLSAFNHGRKILEMESARLCCGFDFDRPGRLDYLDLLQAIGHDNLLRYINFESTVQGVPNAALAFAGSIESVYKDHPYFTLEKARAETNLAKKVEGAERQGLLNSAFSNAFNTMIWEQGQSAISDSAMRLTGEIGQNPYGFYDNLYSTDIPFRAGYWAWGNGGDPQTIETNSVAALRNATSEIGALLQLASHFRFQGEDAKIDALMKSVKGRFAGSPSVNELLAREALLRNDTAEAIAYHRENVRIAPAFWQSYEALGILLFESGKVEEAAKLYLSYPGFMADSKENRVGIANHANLAGSQFFWSGHFELAKPFFQVSVNQESGSGGELSSKQRLSLMKGDLAGAMAASLERGQRYGDSYGYRDYLGMLHATGHSKEAWAGFGILAREATDPNPWESALVGQHMAGATEPEVVTWIRQVGYRDTNEINNTAAIHLLRFAATDRTPSKELAGILEQIDRPTWLMEGYRGLVVRPMPNGRSEAVLGPDLKGHAGILPNNVFAQAPKHRVKSDLAYFAQGYRALKAKDFAAAKAAFQEAAALYDLNGQSSFMLPYYALASAKAGDTSGVNAILARAKSAQERFDYQLAKAILAGSAHRDDDALQSLILARHRRPFTESRPFLTQYTYGEIAEIVAEMTGSAKIRDEALDWARQSQRFEPWHAWSYAIEARLTKEPAARKRAIAMAHYLDPKSERLGQFKQEEIDAAVKAFGSSNPFLGKSEKAPGGKET